MDPAVRRTLDEGTVIPAVPLALNAGRKFDERRQRALLRYYAAAGAGGMAVGVHTTQFAIREPRYGLFQPVLRVAAEVMDEIDAGLEGPRRTPLVRVGGICGETRQAVGEAEFLQSVGYHTGLLNLGALRDADEDDVIRHCREVAKVIPLFGFYLGLAVGGRKLPYSFWRKFAEIDNVVAIKVACFNRYQTLDCVRAVAEAGRSDVALYTGNDDNIVVDLIAPLRFTLGGTTVQRRFVGGLLGHWAVWTTKAVELLAQCRKAVQTADSVAWHELLARAGQVTDANAALFDPQHNFAGCLPGIASVLVRQGLLEGVWCLDPDETLSPGQQQEIDRVTHSYPHLTDDAFVAEHLERWRG